MFRIESYIAPLLLGYIDKYVKLRKEDFQLSLWGGDAVLNKLDLRTESLEEALNLPIVFTSGQVYELRIHVPWTRLGYEPVIITINTVECVLRLKDSRVSERDSGRSSEKSSSKQQTVKVQGGAIQNVPDDMPAGYLQSWIRRIVSNVTIVINNLILKFVEDDIVLSMNVKSVECYTVNGEWARSFVELSEVDLVMRRIVEFHDLTLCLDRRNASGRIDSYQDPLLYRCLLVCRWCMEFDNVNAKMPFLTKMHVMCEKLEISLTDVQLPMFARLVELCMALYYGTFQLSHTSDMQQQEKSVPHSSSALSADGFELVAPNEAAAVKKQGWGSWAWSYISTALPAADTTYDDATGYRNNEPAMFEFAFYCRKLALTIKVSESVLDSPSFSQTRLMFSPFLLLEGEGIAMEMKMKGEVFLSVQVGFSASRAACLGEAMCSMQDVDTGLTDKFWFRSGDYGATHTLRGSHYMSDSLFNDTQSQLLTTSGADVSMMASAWDATAYSPWHYRQRYTEAYALAKYETLWLDYMYCAEKVNDGSELDDDTLMTERRSAMGEEEEKGQGQGQVPGQVESSHMKVVIGPLHITITSGMVQRLHKVLYCIQNHDYPEPYSKPPPEIVDWSRAPPNEHLLRQLQTSLSTRCQTITVIRATVSLFSNNLPTYDVRKKKVTVVRKKDTTKTTGALASSRQPVPLRPVLVLTLARVEMESRAPMYSRQVVKAVSMTLAPSSELMDMCHKHFITRVTGAEVNLCFVDASGQWSTAKNLIKPLSAAIYHKALLLPMYWANILQPRSEVIVELAQVTFSGTKADLMMSLSIAYSWLETRPAAHRLHQWTLLDTVRRTDGTSEPLPTLEMSVCGLHVRLQDTTVVSCVNCSLTSLYILI